MQPVLFVIGEQTISSLGLFLVLGLLASMFILWRLILLYELDKDKTIDVVILTFVSGLIFSRVYFVLFHLAEFDSFTKIVFFNRYPGLSFWGGLFGAMLILSLLSLRGRHKFWQLADYLIVSLYLGISITSLGCLLASCQYGLPSDLFFAVRQVGLIDKRFPLQIFESGIFLIFFVYLWRKVLKYHFEGQIAGVGLIWLGVLKFLLEFARGDSQKIAGFFALGHLYSLAIISLGLYAYYTQSTKRLTDHLIFLFNLIKSSDKRKSVVLKLKKQWYNHLVNWKLRTTKFGRKLPRRLHVKANPEQFE